MLRLDILNAIPQPNANDCGVHALAYSYNLKKSFAEVQAGVVALHISLYHQLSLSLKDTGHEKL